MLPHFFRHYDPIVDRYFVFDDGSDDGTLEMLQAHPKVVVRPFERRHPASLIRSQTIAQNSFWKHSRGLADWVLITDVDEHQVRAGGASIRRYLRHCRNARVTLLPSLGFNILAEIDLRPDIDLHTAVHLVQAEPDMNKLGFFDPNAIAETNFADGRHDAHPTGRVLLPPRDEMALLHFKHLGPTRTFERQRREGQRLLETDHQRGIGTHWLADEERYLAVWRERLARAVELQPVLRAPARHGQEPRWWSDLARAAGRSPLQRLRLAAARAWGAWQR
ncbi:MAG: glycosyltransferase family 2 protein [Devosia sp.]|nr:glycosyltransferase family 2 protein [Devosia sp.]